MFEICAGAWHLQSGKNDEMNPPLFVLHVHPRIVALVSHSSQVDV